MSVLQELEVALDDERRSGDEARQAVTVLERKRIALQTELEDVRSLLETVSTSILSGYIQRIHCRDFCRTNCGPFITKRLGVEGLNKLLHAENTFV